MAQNPQPQPKSQTAEIMKKLEAIDKRLEDIENNLKLFSTDTLKKLDEIAVSKTQAPARNRSANSGSKNSASSTTPTDRKPPTSALYWFRALWAKDAESREHLMHKYLDKETVNKLNTHMETDPDAKTKVGPAKSNEEIKFLWKYLGEKNSTVLKNIKKDYDEFIQNEADSKHEDVSKIGE